MAAVEEKAAATAAVAAEAAIEEKEADSTVSIDVDVDPENVMEWEVETEAAEEPAEAYAPEEPYADEYDDIPVAKSINKHVFVLVFSYALGIFGVDRFVRGQTLIGLVKLLTFGGFGFWYLADLVIAIIKAYGGPYRGLDDLLFDINGRYIY